MSIARRWLWGAVVLLVAGPPTRAPGAEGPDDAASGADDPTLIALAVALSCAEPPEGAAAAPAGDAEMEIVATVRARTLRFDEVPSAEAFLRAVGEGKVTWRAERVNLPLHPVPGVVYHDVRMRLTIGSDAAGIATLLREARRASRGIRIEDALPAQGGGPRVVEVPVVAPATGNVPVDASTAGAAQTASATPSDAATPSTPTPTASATPTPTAPAPEPALPPPPPPPPVETAPAK